MEVGTLRVNYVALWEMGLLGKAIAISIVVLAFGVPGMFWMVREFREARRQSQFYSPEFLNEYLKAIEAKRLAGDPPRDNSAPPGSQGPT